MKIRHNIEIRYLKYDLSGNISIRKNYKKIKYNDFLKEF